jgi:hypothetical protein
MTSNIDPMTIRVQVTAPGRWNGVGGLTVALGYLLCSAGRFIGRLSKVSQVRQDGNRVNIYRARLSPSWGNCRFRFVGTEMCL